MANNRQATRSRIKQVVYSEPRKVFKEKYLTEKGQDLLNRGLISKKEAWNKYGKKRYTINPDAKPVKVITHVKFTRL